MRIIAIICVLTLFSCSAKYHYRKALKKGLEVVKTSDTIRITTKILLFSTKILKYLKQG
jgi:hypothetical protein